MKPIFSSWPYVSGELHLGRLIGSFIPADCYRRLLSLNLIEATHYSGLDCYGEKSIVNLDKKIKEVHELHLSIFKKLDIALTYGSTASDLFKTQCIDNLKSLKLNNSIILKNISYPYCNRCATEKRLKRASNCDICNNRLVEKEEERLIIYPLNKKDNSSRKYEEVERPSLTPGLQSPFNKDKKIWVWIQALHGYQYISKGGEGGIYFYGKDNEYFHKNLLPALYPKRTGTTMHYVSNYLLVGDKKMSGSKNNYLTISLFEGEEDFLRLFLLSYNLKNGDKNFSNDSYINFKSWIIKKVIPVLDGNIDYNSADCKITSNKLLEEFQKNKSFSCLIRRLQESIGRRTFKTEANCIIKILCPRLYDRN